MKLLHPFLALGVALLAGCSTEEVEQGDEDLIGGKPGGDRFPSVVLMDLPAGRCGGAKIGPKRLVTAAHCVTHLERGVEFQLVASRGPVMSARVTKVDAGKIRPNRTQDRGELSSSLGFDLAIIDIDIETPDIPAATLDLTPLSPGEKIVIVGAGCIVDQDTPEPVEGAREMQMRYTVNRVEEVSTYHYYASREGTNGAEGRVCKGDSGTPAFRYVRSGKHMQIVGVNSFKSPQYEIWNAITRIDSDAPAPAQRWLRANGL